jgi:hypothetical protein
MACAWSKWREARELFYDGLISREEMLEIRRDLFMGVATMDQCKKVHDAWYDDYIWDQVEEELG